MAELPPIRESEHSIEIDAKKGKWPFVRALWGLEEATGKRRLALIVDGNEVQHLVSEGTGIGVIVLTEKKAAALRDFLDRTL